MSDPIRDKLEKLVCEVIEEQIRDGRTEFDVNTIAAEALNRSDEATIILAAEYARTFLGHYHH